MGAPPALPNAIAWRNPLGIVVFSEVCLTAERKEEWHISISECGKWELVCHEPGTMRFYLVWHWVKEFYPEYKGVKCALIGMEEFGNDT